MGLAKAAKTRRARSAATLTGPALYQHWLAKDGLPQPKGSIRIDVVPTTRGGSRADAYTDPTGQAVIEAGPGFSPHDFYHELGHAFDYQNMNDLARTRFRAYLHDSDPWGAQGAASTGEPNPPREKFAELYRILAQHPHVADTRRAWQHYRDVGTFGYFDAAKLPTFFQMRKIRKLIRSVA